IIFSVSAVIGQLKWDWYEHEGVPHPLDDMEAFDGASRGPLGATKLLLGRTARSIPTLMAAIVVICALAVDPFVQQVVGSAQVKSYVPSGPGNEAWTERQTRPAYFPNNRPDYINTGPHRDYSDPDWIIYLDYLNGAIWNNASVYDLPAHCPSGNCQFDSFETLEFCTDSAVVTDLDKLYLNCSADASWAEDFQWLVDEANGTHKDPITVVENSDCTVGFRAAPDTPPLVTWTFIVELSISTTPRGRLMGYIMKFPTTVVDAPDDFHTGVMQYYLPDKVDTNRPFKALNPLSTLGSFRFSRPQSSPTTKLKSLFDATLKLEAAEWATLALCKTTHKVSVANGSTSVATKRTFGSLVYRPSPNPLSYNFTRCWSPEEGKAEFNANTSFPNGLPQGPVQRTHSGVNFTTDPETMSFCASHFELGIDVGNRLTGMTQTSVSTDPNKHGYGPLWASSFSSSYEDVHNRIISHGLGPVMESIAAALNNFSRSRTDGDVIRVYGSVLVSETVVAVRWHWLILPLALEVLGFALVLTAMFRRRGVAELWKDSLLAVLYHGLDREDDTLHRESARTLSEIKAAAGQTQVRLLAKPSHEGGRIVLASA
ncbi:hypothetical protein QBC39DRAFT_253404, partial [Podospora conica]